MYNVEDVLECLRGVLMGHCFKIISTPLSSWTREYRLEYSPGVDLVFSLTEIENPNLWRLAVAQPAPLSMSGLSSWLPNTPAAQHIANQSFYGVNRALYEELTKTTCAHQWQDYHGLIESYKFCTKCDQKQEEKQ